MRPLEPVAAQPVPRLGEVVDVVDPLLSQPSAEGLVHGRELGPPAARGQCQSGAVGETVLPQRVHGDEVELPLQGTPGLAEQVAQHRGERGRGGAAVPGEAVLLDLPDGSADLGEALDDGHLVAQLGQPGGAGAAGEPAPDHHHACHVRTLGE